MKKITDIYSWFNVSQVNNDIIIIDSTISRVFIFHNLILILYIPLLFGISTYNQLKTVLGFALALLFFLLLVLLYLFKTKICTKKIVFDRINKQVTIQNHFKFKQIDFKEIFIRERKVKHITVKKMYVNNNCYIGYFNNDFHEILQKFMSSDEQFLKYDLVHFKQQQSLEDLSNLYKHFKLK